MLAINYMTRSFGELFQVPLDYEQAAPIGFLFIEKAFFHFFRHTDWSVRLLPFLASMGSIFLMARLTRRVLGERRISLIPLVFFAISPMLIFYASEAKQYSVDAFYSLLLFVLFEEWLRTEKTKTLVFFSMAVSVGTLFSQPSIFVSFALFGFVWLQYMIVPEKRKNRHLGLILVSGALLSVVIFALNYHFLLAPYTKLNFLLRYWGSAFMPMPPWSDWKWFSYIWNDWVRSTLGFEATFSVILLLLFISGILWAFTHLRRENNKGAIIVSLMVFIFLLTLLVSAYQKYPVKGRMLLFCLPLFYLLLGAGLCFFKDLLKEKYANGTIFILVCILIVPNLERHTASYRITTNAKPLLRYIKKNWRNNDMVCMTNETTSVFLFYQERYRFKKNDYFAPFFAIKGDRREIEQFFIPQYFTKQQNKDALKQLICSSMKDKRRIWFLSTQVFGHNETEHQIILDALSELGEVEKVDAFPWKKKRYKHSCIYLFYLNQNAIEKASKSLSSAISTSP